MAGSGYCCGDYMGATAYNYTNTGFSVAMIIFALFVIYTLFKREKVPAIHLDRKLVGAFAILYGALFIATLFHLDNIKICMVDISALSALCCILFLCGCCSMWDGIGISGK